MLEYGKKRICSEKPVHTIKQIYNYKIRRNHQFAVYEYHTKCAASGKPLMHFLRKKPP